MLLQALPNFSKGYQKMARYARNKTVDETKVIMTMREEKNDGDAFLSSLIER